MSETGETLQVLSKGWVRTSVGDIFNIVGGGTPSTKVSEFWKGDIPWITSADIYGLKDIRPRKKINKKAIDSSATNLVPNGSIIVVTRVSLGKIAITDVPICFSQDSQALIGNSFIFPDYALYHLSKAVQIFRYKHRGTTIAGVTKKQLSDLPFLLPPLLEQHRIVTKIDELFTKLDAGVQQLRSVEAQLNVYRPAVLNAAMTGKLTEQWRAEHKDEIQSASKLKRQILDNNSQNKYRLQKKSLLSGDIELPKLPINWDWIEWGEISEWITYGFTRPMPHKEEGIPIVTAKNVINSKIDLLNAHKTTKNAYDSLSEKDRPKKGDILITKDGTIGRAAIVGDEQPFCINQSVAVIWLRSCPIDRNYLLLVIESPFIQKKIWSKARGVAIKHLSITDFAKLPLPLPSQKEQSIIAEEVERRLIVLNETEKNILLTLNHADRLRQSILKRAFQGKLVPQDPTDEPATVLLERIKVEKLQQTVKKKSKIDVKQQRLITYVK